MTTSHPSLSFIPAIPTGGYLSALGWTRDPQNRLGYADALMAGAPQYPGGQLDEMYQAYARLGELPSGDWANVLPYLRYQEGDLNQSIPGSYSFDSAAALEDILNKNAQARALYGTMAGWDPVLAQSGGTDPESVRLTQLSLNPARLFQKAGMTPYEADVWLENYRRARGENPAEVPDYGWHGMEQGYYAPMAALAAEKGIASDPEVARLLAQTLSEARRGDSIEKQRDEAGHVTIGDLLGAAGFVLGGNALFGALAGAPMLGAGSVLGDIFSLAPASNTALGAMGLESTAGALGAGAAEGLGAAGWGVNPQGANMFEFVDPWDVMGDLGVYGLGDSGMSADLLALLDSPAGGGGSLSDWWLQAASPGSNYGLSDLFNISSGIDIPDIPGSDILKGLFSGGGSASTDALGKILGGLTGGANNNLLGLAPILGGLAYAYNMAEPDLDKLESLYDTYKPEAMTGLYDLNTNIMRENLLSNLGRRGVAGSSFANMDLTNLQTVRDVGRNQLLGQAVGPAANIASELAKWQAAGNAIKTDLIGRGLYSIGTLFGGGR